LRITGVPRLVSALGEPQLSLGDLAPQQNQLQIDFVGLGFGSGEVLRYQYLLEGADTDWSAPDEHRTVTYASLAPGRYRFTVRAVNSDGMVSAHPAAIDFTILSPLWRRWWALALIATTAGALSYAGYRYRVARLLELVHIRTRIATDLHDDVGANLTRIAVLAEVASHTHDVGPLASIARIARESVSSMSDIVWAINPKRDSLIDLTRRMRQHADELFTLRDIELRFSAPGAADNLRIGVDIRRDLLLIFKEAVNNAARHSRCSLVEIEFRIEASRLVLAIIDNGIGFDSRSAADGQGLGSMQRRAQTLHGSLEIASRSGAGTTVRLDVPI
jgi:signal transduction histidine kinase